MIDFEIFSWSNPNVFGKLNHIPNVCVHLTTKDRVQSILKHGLILKSPRNTTEGVSRGVYLAASADALLEDCMDTFSTDMVTLLVDVTSIKHKLKPDPEWRQYQNSNPLHCVDDIAWYSEESISPSLITQID